MCFHFFIRETPSAPQDFTGIKQQQALWEARLEVNKQESCHCIEKLHLFVLVFQKVLMGPAEQTKCVKAAVVARWGSYTRERPFKLWPSHSFGT